MEKRKVFKDPEKLAELQWLILEGYSYTSIARHFECDHTSVIWQARRMGVEADPNRSRKPGKALDPNAIPPMKHPPTSRLLIKPQKSNRVDLPLEDTLLGEKINPGLSTYQDYVVAEKKRKLKEEGLEHF